MQTDEQILAELKQASENLLMMSESDYPFAVIRWEQMAEVIPDFLRREAAQPPGALVAVESLEDFFRAATTVHEGQSFEARQAVERYRRLVQVLRKNLRDARVYKVGQVNIPVYIAGRAPSGNWLGLSTRVVET